MLEAVIIALLVLRFFEGRAWSEERDRLIRAALAETSAERMIALHRPTARVEDPDRPPQAPLPEGV